MQDKDASKDTKAVDTCPECQADLSNVDRQGHAAMHWRGTGTAAPQVGTEAYKRQQAVLGEK